MAAPFAVGGDPSVDPNDFRVTTFASGLNYPFSMQQLSDGSLLVATSRPNSSPGQFWDSTGELVRLVDADGNGEADGPGTVLASGLPGMLTSMRVAGDLVFATSSQSFGEQITVLRAGATPGDPLTQVGVIDFDFPVWLHTTYALAVRPTPGAPGRFDLFFNVGSQNNFDQTSRTIPLHGLITANLNGDSIYKVTVDPAPATPVLSNLTQIATGLRNAAGLAFDTRTGDLYLQDNGIDGFVDANEPTSADELNRIAFADIGGAIENFGFPNNYIQYRTGIEVGSGGIDPLFAFQPIPDPANGSESEGPVEIAMAPPGFPSGLNNGVFVGISGRGGTGGLENEENPLVFANLSTGNYFHFISNDEPNIGHLDGVLSTNDSLFVSDIDRTGRLFGTARAGVIYQIRSIAPPSDGALFADDFAGAGLGPAWATAGGDWEQAGGLLRQAGLGAADPKKAHVAGVAFPADVEVRARVKVDSWAGTDYARAGLSLGDDPDGRGYNLLFHQDTHTVQFLHDHVAWGNRYDFAWQVGAWYHFALRQEGGVLLGKVWADGQAEPAGWMFRQDGWAARAGAPGLNGGANGTSTASFDDFRVRPVVSPLFADDFAGAGLGPAWATAGGDWEQAGGLLRQAGLGAADPKKAHVAGVAFPADVEVRARVKVDSWAGTDYARAGLSLGDDPDGRGYNLLFHQDTHTVQFLHDHVAWGNRYDFAWQVGAWYHFALRQEGGVLLGKVWADGQAEPAGWMFRQDGWAARAGAPGLNGGANGASTASFDDFRVYPV